MNIEKKIAGTVVVLLVLWFSTIFGQNQTEKKPTEVQLLKAQLVKLQMEHLELQREYASCRQQNLAGVARSTEEDILKSVDAKPGQKFDWNTLTVTPVPPQPAKSEKP
jgi:hypothetical protein